MNKNSKQNGPGRPKYIPSIPHGKFTFTDLEVENGVNPKTGKGKKCTTLTLRKWLKRELSNRRTGAVMLLKDTLAEPNGKSGLGRKQLVYTHRTGVAAPKASAPRKAKDTAPTADVSQSTKDYEATKNALLADTAVTIATPDPTPAPAPEVTPAPETTAEATPEAAPVAADPAPTAEAETVPAAEPVTA
jgi:hypothetical protein